MVNEKTVDDRFDKFGIVGFTTTTKTNEFIDHLELGKVTGTRCKGCGLIFFPPRADCYQCLSSDMEWFEVAGSGKLVTFSKLQYAPAGFEADVPYSIALLDFGAYKVFGRIAVDTPEEELKAGIPMRIKVIKLANSRISYVFERE
jgi:uncharacterized OB-fold protein